MSRRFTKIKGDNAVSQVRRLPRLGKIRGGYKVKKREHSCKHDPKQDCIYCTYPKETPHFVVPEEVAAIYGDKPTELDILIPIDDTDIIFPQSYEYYGSGAGLKCNGDGEIAYRLNDETGEREERKCPCELLEKKKCMQRAHLSFILPEVSLGGVFTLTTSSFHSIVGINSSLDYVRSMVGRIDNLYYVDPSSGKVHVLLKLKREPVTTHHEGKRQTHYAMRIELNADISKLHALKERIHRAVPVKYELEAMTPASPVSDDGPVVTEVEMGVIEEDSRPITRSSMLERIAAMTCSADIDEFMAWATSNARKIEEAMSSDDRAHIRTTLRDKRTEIHAAEAMQLKGLYESKIATAKTLEELSNIWEEAIQKVEGETRVKLQMAKDMRAQALKREGAK